MVADWHADGFTVFDHDPATAAWAGAAKRSALQISADPEARRAHLRHGDTWFVGVDVLPNDTGGSMDGLPLAGGWADLVAMPGLWHRAQLSIVYPGYPRRDADEPQASHDFRMRRHAAHVDGLLPVGAARRRFLREPHAFILGLPLNSATAAPLMVWPGSHRLMGAAFRQAIGTQDPATVDLTDAYTAARRKVFAETEPRSVQAEPGQAILLHRHLLHGVSAWNAQAVAPDEGRMIAYFRPEFAEGGRRWLAADPQSGEI